MKDIEELWNEFCSKSPVAWSSLNKVLFYNGYLYAVQELAETKDPAWVARQRAELDKIFLQSADVGGQS